MSLTDIELIGMRNLIDGGWRYALIDRRHGGIEPMDRREAIDFARDALDGRLTGTWAELLRPPNWIRAWYRAWCLVLDDDGSKLTLIGVGSHAPQPAN